MVIRVIKNNNNNPEKEGSGVASGGDVLRSGLTEREQWSRDLKEVLLSIWWKNIPAGERDTCKGPGVGMRLAWLLRNRKWQVQLYQNEQGRRWW